MTNAFPGRILLATDGSEDAAEAARAASDLSGRGGSELHVVLAWHLPLTVSPTSVPVGRFEEGAREVLEAEVGRIERSGIKVAEAHLRTGDPVDEIVCLAGELGAGLILTGSRGVGTFERLARDSVSEAVVHRARCPVLVAFGGGWPPGRVVIGDDGSEAARGAGELAARIGALFEVPVALLRAALDPMVNPLLPEDQRALRKRLSEESLRLAEEQLEKRAGALGDACGSRPAVRVVSGDAPRVILDAAREEPSTLIALGSRGLGTARRPRLGSVSSRVLRSARGSVLVHPPPGR